MNQTTKSQRKTADTHKAEDRYTYTTKTLHMNTTPQKPPSTTSLTHTIPKTAPNHYNCMLHLFFHNIVKASLRTITSVMSSEQHASSALSAPASYCFRQKFQLTSSAINLRFFLVVFLVFLTEFFLRQLPLLFLHPLRLLPLHVTFLLCSSSSPSSSSSSYSASSSPS